MLQKIIAKLIEKKNLNDEDSKGAISDIMDGNATDAQIASFLTALRMKGETIDEISACARVMRQKAISIYPKVSHLVDTCGTGGDNSGTFNISTAAAFVASGAGAFVAKHGNRSMTSKCGSADVLKEIGINIELSPKDVKRCIEEIGIGFMFAPVFNPAMRHASNARKEIGFKTIFNILGPLTNPANAKSQLIGVFDEGLLEVVVQVLKNLGSRHVIAVNADGMDEISICSNTKVCELKDSKIESYTLNPQDFGFKKSPISKIRGGLSSENAKIMIGVLNGAKGPRRDIVVLNAAAALLAADIAKDYGQGIKLAAESIDSKKALGKLEELKNFI